MRIDLSNVTLKNGKHSTRARGMCAMEAAACLAGEPHSDNPKCVSSVIATFLRSWNDSLPDDETRTRLLLPLLPRVLNTAADCRIELKRSYMTIDWLARVSAPAWLELAGLVKYATTLRALAPIADEASAKASIVVTRAAQAAAGKPAAMAWATAITGEAAAWDVAMGMGTETETAWAALRATAIAATSGLPLAPTVALLQTSACDLVLRMAAVRE